MSDSLDHVVVVGASVAGVTAVETLRRQGFDGSITLVGEESHLPYDRPPLSKQVLSGAWGADRIVLRDHAALDRLGVDIRLGLRASGLDLENRVVRLGDGGRVAYDGLIIATGVTSRLLPFGHGLPGVHVLRTVDDAIALRSQMVPGRRLVVIGAGFIGCEVAATARKIGLEVCIVAPASPMLRKLGPEIAEHAARLHRDHGVDVRCGVSVSGFTGALKVTGVELTTGEIVPADLVLVAIGSRPSTDWLNDSGLKLDNGVVCDALCRAAPGVYAAGDVATWWNDKIGGYVRVEHRTNATEQAIAAASNLLGADTPFVGVPYFWSDQYDKRIQGYGSFPPDAEIVIAHGDPYEGRFVARYVQDNRITGVLAWNMPKELRKELPSIGQTAAVV